MISIVFHPSLPRSAHGLPLVLTLSFRVMKVAKLLATALRITKNPGSCAPDRKKSPSLVQELRLDKKTKTKTTHRVSKFVSGT